MDEIINAWSSALFIKLGVNGAHFSNAFKVIPVVPPVTWTLWIFSFSYMISASVDRACDQSGQNTRFEEMFENIVFCSGLFTSGIK